MRRTSLSLIAARNTYTFAFDGLGPLAPLLIDGEPVTSPITLSLSLSDFIDLLTGDDTDAELGPFTSVGDVVVRSDGALLRRVGDTVVSYAFVAADVPVAELADAGRISFDIDDLSADHGVYALSTVDAGITFPRQGQLAGLLTYRIQGPGVDVNVLSDFGTGSGYPVNTWECVTTPTLTP